MRGLIRFAIQRPKLVVALWVAAIIAAAPFAMRLEKALRGSTDTVRGSPSELVSRQLNQSFGEGSSFVFPVTLTSSSIGANDPRFAAAAVRVETVLDSSGMVDVRHFWN